MGVSTFPLSKNTLRERYYPAISALEVQLGYTQTLLHTPQVEMAGTRLVTEIPPWAEEGQTPCRQPEPTRGWGIPGLPEKVKSQGGAPWSRCKAPGLWRHALAAGGVPRLAQVGIVFMLPIPLGAAMARPEQATALGLAGGQCIPTLSETVEKEDPAAFV